MNIFSWLLRSKEPAGEYHRHQQAIIVHFIYGSTNLQFIYALEDQLRNTLSNSGVGEYEGKSVAKDGSDGFFYMYGPDAEALYRLIDPLLAGTVFTHTAQVTLRFGPAKRGTPQRVIQRTRPVTQPARM